MGIERRWNRNEASRKSPDIIIIIIIIIIYTLVSTACTPFVTVNSLLWLLVCVLNAIM